MFSSSESETIFVTKDFWIRMEYLDDFILNRESDPVWTPLQVGRTCLRGLVGFLMGEAQHAVLKHGHC